MEESVGRGDEGEESIIRDAKGDEQPDDSDIPAEDSAVAVPPVPECGSEDCSDRKLPHTEADDLSCQARSGDGGADGVPLNPVQDNIGGDLSHLTTADNMENQTAEEEDADEEELIVLDPEHPQVRRFQTALKNHLSKQLERLNMDINEKLAVEKAEGSHMQELRVEVYRVQEQLAKLQASLEDHHQTTVQATTERQQAQDQLEAMRSQYRGTVGQADKDRTNVFQLQAEIENLLQHLCYMQDVNADLLSHVRVMKNATRKADAEKTKAEEQKNQQDLYVERLTKDLERLTEKMAVYEAQASTQAKETQAAKEVLSEAQMEMDSLAMERKQLLQQWNSSLVGMKKRDEAFTAMQKALRLAQHQVLSLDREIESYEQSITKEEEQNEILTMQLNRSQVDVSSSKRLISQIQSQQEALQPQYTTYLSTLQEMERTLARLNTEKSLCQAELSNLSRQLEKESASSLELEDRIMAQMQQEFTHDKAAKYSQRLINKMASLKKEKIGQLQQLENELAMVRLESSEVSQCLDDLVPALEALEKDITERNKLLTTCQAKIASQVIIIERNQATITTYNKKIKQIQESTGHMDLSPLQIHAESMAKELEELEVDIKKKQLLWMRQQGVLVGLTKEKQTNSEEMHKLQAQYTIFQQRNICTEREMEVERREQADVERHMKMLRGDMLKLNSLLSHNDKLKQTLQQENTLVETDFLHRLKEAEREAIEVQMRLEKTREEKKRLLNSLVEAERQVMLWEKKTQLLRKTFSAVNSEVFQGDIRQMKAEIHRMELHHSQLMKQQERLQRESEATVSRMENISLRREARSSKKQTTQSHLNHIIQGLRHNIKDTHKQVAECEEVIKGLQESQVSVSSRLALKKQELTEQHNTTSVLTSDLLKLQDSKDMNLARLLALQNRAKHLQALREGRYTPLSNREAVGAALQRQTERMHAVSAIVHQVYEEFPQHQGALYRLTLALAARMQALD